MKIYTDKDNKQSPELYESIVRLSGNEDFQRFINWFRDSLWEYRANSDNLVNSEGKPFLFWNQGKCQMLGEILRTVGESREIAEKIRKNAKSG